MIKKENIKISNKKTTTCHIVKIGYFTGINNHFANAKYYEIKIYQKQNYEKQIVELKKEYVFEHDYKS